jgi:phage host-nuclease inhibitor protein Gam
MAKKLIKKTTIKDFEAANGKLADLKMTDAELQKVEAELNIKRTKLEQEYADKIDSLRENKLLLQTDIELFAEMNKDNLLDKRSWALFHGDFGYRQSQKLATLPKFNWGRVLDSIKSTGGKFLAYIRTKEEIAKDELKTDIQQGAITAVEANKIGVKIDVIDNFYIELNSLKVEPQK